MLMVPCCSTVADTALAMLCQLRAHLLFHVFCFGCVMLQKQLAVAMHFSGTFSVRICLSLFWQITACLLTAITDRTHPMENKK